MDSEERERFDILLTTPPTTILSRALPTASDEVEEEGFLALMNATAGRVQ